MIVQIYCLSVCFILRREETISAKQNNPSTGAADGSRELNYCFFYDQAAGQRLYISIGIFEVQPNA